MQSNFSCCRWRHNHRFATTAPAVITITQHLYFISFNSRSYRCVRNRHFSFFRYLICLICFQFDSFFFLCFRANVFKLISPVAILIYKLLTGRPFPFLFHTKCIVCIHCICTMYIVHSHVCICIGYKSNTQPTNHRLTMGS